MRTLKMLPDPARYFQSHYVAGIDPGKNIQSPAFDSGNPTLTFGSNNLRT